MNLQCFRDCVKLGPYHEPSLIFPIRISTAAPVRTTQVISHAVVQPTVMTPAAAPLDPPQLPVIAERPVRQTVMDRVSAYSSTIDQTDGGPYTTASGARVHDGTIAANWLPFGTKVKLPDYCGDQVFVIQDRMNAKWGGRRMDIWMPGCGQVMD